MAQGLVAFFFSWGLARAVAVVVAVGQVVVIGVKIHILSNIYQ